MKMFAVRFQKVFNFLFQVYAGLKDAHGHLILEQQPYWSLLLSKWSELQSNGLTVIFNRGSPRYVPDTFVPLQDLPLKPR